MAQPSKAQLLNEIHTLLRKRYKPKPERGPGRLSVLESVVYGVCHEGTTREQANQALVRFKDGFFDWNEVRVSTLGEVQGALAGLPDPEGRAYRIRRFLRQLFERTYGFNLDPLAKKPLKESIKALAVYEALGSDYVEATVTQQALGGHAIPVDGPCRRALERLGIADPGAGADALRSLLERAVPKNRGVEFVELIEDLAHDTCVEPEPDCPRCELRKLCPTAAARRQEAHLASKTLAAATRAAGKDAANAAAKAALKTPPGASAETPHTTGPAKDPAKDAKPTKGRPGGSK